MMPINRAKVIAKLAHKGQMYGSADYFLFHVESVVRRVALHAFSTNDAMIIAYLHDVIEDTEVTALELGILGVPMHIIDCVKCISKQPGELYLTYIQRILVEGSAATILVKSCDLMENAYQCRSVLNGYTDPVSRTINRHAISRLRRYESAIDLIGDMGPAGIVQEVRNDSNG